jgi:hypothetical protein
MAGGGEWPSGKRTVNQRGTITLTKGSNGDAAVKVDKQITQQVQVHGGIIILLIRKIKTRARALGFSPITCCNVHSLVSSRGLIGSNKLLRSALSSRQLARTAQDSFGLLPRPVLSSRQLASTTLSSCGMLLMPAPGA